MADRPVIGEISWERMIRAVEKVKERLHRAAQILDSAGIPYAVAGGNAVAAWVSRIDEAAVRNTRDVDILIRRDDLPKAITAMEQAGFIYRHVRHVDMFLDGPDVSPRDAVHLLFAGEKVRPEYESSAPDVEDCDATGAFRVVNLESLVLMKLTSYRDKDRTHLRDLIDIGLVDSTWPAKFSPILAERLQTLLDDPDG
ncbi:nucleotidyltransferase family protein [Planctomicrobium piriforme]|uniref:Nucleotidyl transferase AbiEii toxin, Type IV TA system n=1 Tax=Planctomicrobium piriforme TaxID=1576369 RepID=A0A1I3J4N9_9PLAN|nr:nucleotidyltransferase family protein [Planctomicrobium piriforme]SFI55149.1 Nucleotidyl transferase AbiEii toxin, Type IV TA system [Planctomicrobium piriforme]